MKVLVIGATGNVGSHVVASLQQRNADVRVLVRKADDKSKFAQPVEAVVGDLLDPASVEAAMTGVEKLFLVNGVTPDELTQALIAYNTARSTGIQHITYLSIFRGEQSRNVAHIASKVTMEAVIREYGIPFTILRPGAFFQNDLALKDLLLGPGIYPNPVGTDGIAAIDLRDLGDLAALTLTEEGHTGKTYDVVSSSMLKGPELAVLWSDVLGKQVIYPGTDPKGWEQQMKHVLPAWLAFDLRTMFESENEKGFASSTAQSERLAHLLGRPTRTYEQFAREASATWKQ
jgi:uncharacterized protein YbjT (DUF2867 family)